MLYMYDVYTNMSVCMCVCMCVFIYLSFALPLSIPPVRRHEQQELGNAIPEKGMTAGSGRQLCHRLRLKENRGLQEENLQEENGIDRLLHEEA